MISGPADTGMPSIERIYIDSFPSSERRPIPWLSEAAARTDFAVIVAETDGKVCGFATLFLPTDNDNSALLDYLAVDSEVRNIGVGSCLLRSCLAKIGDRPMLIEVETIGDPPDPTRLRRQQFYHHHGCQRIAGVPYILPIPTTGKPPMELMIANAPAEFQRADLARWMTAIYTQVYSCASDDPRLAEMLANTPSTLRLEDDPFSPA
jgi:GNAT superfamily N-acetyltransferase